MDLKFKQIGQTYPWGEAQRIINRIPEWGKLEKKIGSITRHFGSNKNYSDEDELREMAEEAFETLDEAREVIENLLETIERLKEAERNVIVDWEDMASSMALVGFACHLPTEGDRHALYKWLDANIQSRHVWLQSNDEHMILFQDEAEATLFKLTWC